MARIILIGSVAVSGSRESSSKPNDLSDTLIYSAQNVCANSHMLKRIFFIAER